jgi:hypothetical protein
MVIMAHWGDLGFRPIGPKNPADADEFESAKLLAEGLAKIGRYETQHDSRGWWIRDPARVKGQQRPNAVAVATVLDAANHRNLDQYQFVQSLDASYYRDFQFDLDASARHDQVATFSKNPHSAKGIYALTFSLAGCPIKELQNFLSSVLLPAFFNVYKDGKVMFLHLNYKFETRHSVMRAGYTASQYGRLDKLGTGLNPFETMERWQPLMPSVQLRLILELATLLFFPRQQFFTGTRSGLLSVFIPGESFVEHAHEFPASWLDFFKDHWDFAKGERSAANLATLARAASEPDSLKPILDKATYGALEIEELVRWIVDRYNFLAFHQTDPAEFLHEDLVDFVTCFEHALTLDRALRKGMSCVVSAESVVRKEAAMEIADIIGELACYWKLTANGPEHFKTLVHPVQGKVLLKAAFGTAPAPFAATVAEIADAIYTSLRDTIIGSVFVPAKKTSSGILVRNKDLSSENMESTDDFTANVIRALRDTHHGYLTRNDSRSLRPSRYLALVNGTLPEAFARLGPLLALAAVVAPEEIIGWKFMPTGTFD